MGWRSLLGGVGHRWGTGTGHHLLLQQQQMLASDTPDVIKRKRERTASTVQDECEDAGVALVPGKKKRKRMVVA